MHAVIRGLPLASAVLLAGCAAGTEQPAAEQEEPGVARIPKPGPTSDEEPPRVIASSPVEGAYDADPLLKVISVTFSEPMDPQRSEVALHREGHPKLAVSGAWSDGNTRFTVAFDTYLPTGTPLALDLTALADPAGNPLDPASPYLGNGRLDFALHEPDGDDCDDPLVASQASIGNGFQSWYLPPRSGMGREGQLACATTIAGGDMVIAYDKISGTVAEGGALMHVVALGAVGAIDLEVTSEACGEGSVIEKCLGPRDSWDAFLDVPAGRYWLWVADHEALADDFSGAFVSVEEISAAAPAAEGEGCFAPFTATSASYEPPPSAGAAHLWTLPPSLNGFDAAPATGSPAVMSCGHGWNLWGGYGSPGVDAVVEFDKAEASTTLYVEVESPPYGGASLDVEVRSGCDPSSPASVARYCGVLPSAFTVAAPAGPVYLWLATARLEESFPSAELRIREIEAAIGETRARPEPLTQSGFIAPTSTLGLEVPSCFPAGSLVHWYSHSATQTIFSVRGDVAAPIAIFAADGQEIGCSADTTDVALGAVTTPGASLAIAVESPTALSHLTLGSGSYAGIVGAATDLGVTFPGTAPNFPEGTLAVGTSEIFLSSSNWDQVLSFPKAGNAPAVLHGAADGLSSVHLHGDVAFGAGRLFSVGKISPTSGHRLWTIYDEPSSQWGPTAWDEPSAYPAGMRMFAMTYDGAQLIMASRPPPNEVHFFTSLPGSPGPSVFAGSHAGLDGVASIAADAAYFYVLGLDDNGDGGVFRIDRATPEAPALRLKRFDQPASAEYGAIVVDDVTSAKNLYVLDGARVQIIAGPGQAVPVDLGLSVPMPPAYSEGAIAFDVSSQTLYLYDAWHGRAFAIP